MKLFRLMPAILLLAACASAPEAPAQATTAVTPAASKPSTTAVIDPVGAPLLTTVSVAALLVAEPQLLLTTARNVAPLSPAVVDWIV